MKRLIFTCLALFVWFIPEDGSAMSYDSAKTYEDRELMFILDTRQYYENQTMYLAQAPHRVINGVTYISMRSFAERIGYEVRYRQATNEYLMTDGEDELAYTFGDDAFRHNGVEKPFRAGTSHVINGSLMIPLRETAESLGMRVRADLAERKVYINWQETDEIVQPSAITMPKGSFLAGDTVTTEIRGTFHDDASSVWLGESIRHPNGEWIDIPANEIDLNVSGSSPFRITSELTLPDDLEQTGPYEHRLSLWDRIPHEPGANRLFTTGTEGDLVVFHKKETFSDWPSTNGWSAASHRVGRTTFDPANVRTASDRSGLEIMMQTASRKSGEIRTDDRLSYGSYEIRMQVPNHPGTLTGFFFYDAPDFFHEIDIEVMNNPSGEVWFTTYEGGRQRHATKETYDFDPTDGVHVYRIDYFEDYVAFFINGQEMKRFTDGYSHQPMQLMVNYWEPTWLSGARAVDRGTLYIESIKY